MSYLGPIPDPIWVYKGKPGKGFVQTFRHRLIKVLVPWRPSPSAIVDSSERSRDARGRHLGSNSSLTSQRRLKMLTSSTLSLRQNSPPSHTHPVAYSCQGLQRFLLTGGGPKCHGRTETAWLQIFKFRLNHSKGRKGSFQKVLKSFS